MSRKVLNKVGMVQKTVQKKKKKNKTLTLAANGIDLASMPSAPPSAAVMPKEEGHMCRKCKKLFSQKKKCEPTTPKPKVPRDGKLSDDAKKLIRMMALKAILPKRQHGFVKPILDRFKTFDGMRSEGIRALTAVTFNRSMLGSVDAARLFVLAE